MSYPNLGPLWELPLYLDASTSVHERCLSAIEDRLSDLVMVGNPNANIYKYLVPRDETISLPCIMLTLEGERETQPGTLTGTDDIGYPIGVSILDRNDQRDTTNRAKYLLWRQQISRALRHQRLAGVPEIFTVNVEPRAVVDPQLPHFAYFVTGLVARCMSREVRG